MRRAKEALPGVLGIQSLGERDPAQCSCVSKGSLGPYLCAKHQVVPKCQAGALRALVRHPLAGMTRHPSGESRIAAPGILAML